MLPHEMKYAQAEEWVGTYAATMPALGEGQHVFYPNGTTIGLAHFAAQWEDHEHADYVLHAQRVAPLVADSSLVRLMLRTFRASDVDASGSCHGGCGRLGWNDGEIRDFVCAVFEHAGLVPPSEAHIHAVYKAFNADGLIRLDVRECVCLADALIRIAFFGAQHRSRAFGAGPRTGPRPNERPRQGSRGPLGRAPFSRGARVRVARGRQFQYFGAGDLGTVTTAGSNAGSAVTAGVAAGQLAAGVTANSPASCCEVLFDGRTASVSVGTRYLQTLEEYDAEAPAEARAEARVDAIG